MKSTIQFCILIYFLCFFKIFAIAPLTISSSEPQNNVIPLKGDFEKNWTCTNNDIQKQSIKVSSDKSLRTPKDWNIGYINNSFELKAGLTQNCGVKINANNASGIGDITGVITLNDSAYFNYKITLITSDIRELEVLSDSSTTNKYPIGDLFLNSKKPMVYPILDYDLLNLAPELSNINYYIFNFGEKGFIDAKMADTISYLLEAGNRIMIIGASPFEKLDSNNQLFVKLGMLNNPDKAAIKEEQYNDIIGNQIHGKAQDPISNGIIEYNYKFLAETGRTKFFAPHNLKSDIESFLFFVDPIEVFDKTIGFRGKYKSSKFVIFDLNLYSLKPTDASELLFNSVNWLLSPTEIATENSPSNEKFEATIIEHNSNSITINLFNKLNINESPITISIFDILGNHIGTKNIENYQQNSTFNFNTSELNSGSYLIKVQQGQNFQTLKIMIYK